jgi:hypothetical protein
MPCRGSNDAGRHGAGLKEPALASVERVIGDEALTRTTPHQSESPTTPILTEFVAPVCLRRPGLTETGLIGSDKPPWPQFSHLLRASRTRSIGIGISEIVDSHHKQINLK